MVKVYQVPQIAFDIISHPDKENDKFTPLPSAQACNLEKKKKLLKGRKFFFIMIAVLFNTEVLWNVTPCSWLKSYRRFDVSCCFFFLRVKSPQEETARL